MDKVVRQPPLQLEARPQTRPTPMMAQYIEIKAANPDCLLFYHMGDFYELFFEDAQIAARALGIMLTKRGKHLGEDIPMCGVPVERADDYLQKLIALGHRVAVCDNAFAALARARTGDGGFAYGVACVDISTGAFAVCQTSEADLAAALARLEPREIVAAETLCRQPALSATLRAAGVPVTPLGRDAGDGPNAERRLADFFGVATLDGFGALSEAEIAAAAAAILYVERTQKGKRPALRPPMRTGDTTTLEIDAATRSNLELTRSLAGAREGSLLAVIDLTVTPAGARLLSEQIAAPSTNPAHIGRRLDAVSFFVDETETRSRLRALLARVPDIARALSRLSLQRGGPRDLAAVRVGLTGARDIAALFATQASIAADAAREIAALARPDGALEAMIAQRLASELPLDKRAGGFVAKGVDAELDEARNLRDESRRVIASLQARYVELAETRQLKIKHNNFLGFFIEVAQAQGEKLLRAPFDAVFAHRQTMADAMRFSTRELVELEAKIASAADRAQERELALFDELAAAVLAQTPKLQRLAEALARLDVFAALAELAA
ncbi:MAG: DNA mismatch repair protein MutS, partial [Methylocystis sp.]|nr:DNA mismatch repair protein MutS [Methylocystis sp.]